MRLPRRGLTRKFTPRQIQTWKGMIMRITALTTTAILAITTSAALAQEHRRSEFSVGYSNVSAPSNSDIIGIGIKSDWTISGAYGLQGNLSYSDTGDSIATSTVGLHGYYEFPSGTRAGVFIQTEDIYVTGLPFTPTFLTYGVEAMLTLTPQARIELYYAAGDVSDFPAPITGSSSYGVEASYDFSPSLRGRLSYDVDELKSSLPGGNISEMGIGIDYFLNGAGSGVPLILTAEASRIRAFASQDLDTFSLKVTIPIGGEATSAGRQLFGDRNVADAIVVSGG
jgi:hypothetical protein